MRTRWKKSKLVCVALAWTACGRGRNGDDSQLTVCAVSRLAIIPVSIRQLGCVVRLNGIPNAVSVIG
jgi:hypothetical protein